MLKIRLMRIGGKKKPFYRVVAVDERSKRTGGYVELLGTYNPLTEPKEIKLKQDRIDYWIKMGAQLSVGYLRIIGKAPQRPPRKPKKPARNASQSDAGGEKKEEPRAAPAIAAEAPTEEVRTEEPAKVEETAKSSESKAISEVESAPAEIVSTDSDSQQTHSEAQETTEESKDTEPSGASATDEPSTTKLEEKKDEGSA